MTERYSGPIEFERANVSRKLIVVEKHAFFRLSYLKEGLKKRGVVISESTLVFYRLLILNTFPIIRTTHFTFIIYLLYFVHFHFSFNRHTVRARRPVYVLTDFTTLLLARVSTFQLFKTLRNLCFPYVLIYDSLCSFWSPFYFVSLK